MATTTTFTTKQPSESYGISFDFTAYLVTATIFTAEITATDLSTLADATSTVLDDTKQSNTTTVVSGWANGGTSGHDYAITCTIIDSEGATHELDAIMPVWESPPDSGSTVQDIYNNLQYRRDLNVNADALLPVVNMAVRSIAKRLYVLGSNLITGSLSVSIDISEEDAYGVLPSDFWGLKDKPYISGKTYPLKPLPSIEVALQYTTGTPQYYKVIGRRFYVYPAADADCTICGEYFARPYALTETSSTIPYNELFDDLITEYVEHYFRGPGWSPVLNEMLRQGVDLIATKYDQNAPVISSGINWDNLTGR